MGTDLSLLAAEVVIAGQPFDESLGAVRAHEGPNGAPHGLWHFFV